MTTRSGFDSRSKVDPNKESLFSKVDALACMGASFSMVLGVVFQWISWLGMELGGLHAAIWKGLEPLGALETPRSQDFDLIPGSRS